MNELRLADKHISGLLSAHLQRRHTHDLMFLLQPERGLRSWPISRAANEPTASQVWSFSAGASDQICHYLACLWPNLKAKQEINRKWGQITVSVNIPDSSHKGLSARNRFLPFALSLRSSVVIEC